jgi:NTP pyrophosphatase (non-canonical NTP hydrolase)
MSDIAFIIEELKTFRDARDWAQFHNEKDIAVAISVEAAELLELFLWKQAEEADRGRVKEELADILSFCFLLADKYKLDVRQIIEDKIRINNEKYPVDKSKGNARKYNEL